MLVSLDVVKMSSTRKSDNSDSLSRSVLSISKKVKFLDLVEKENKSYSEIGRIFGKNESLIREVVKN